MNTPFPPEPPDPRDEIIQKGSDAGKTVGELYDEVFDADVSDEEYFRRRFAKHFGVNPPSSP